MFIRITFENSTSGMIFWDARCTRHCGCRAGDTKLHTFVSEKQNISCAPPIWKLNVVSNMQNTNYW